MSGEKPVVKTVDVGGVSVKINVTFTQSWDGIMQAVEMQRINEDENSTEVSKVVAIVDYYSQAIANLEEVKEALGGGSVAAAEVFDVLGKALVEATGKN